MQEKNKKIQNDNIKDLRKMKKSDKIVEK
jgi:hypothetical protein